MNKEELKEYIIDMLMLDPWDINELIAEKYSIKEIQKIWNNLKHESKNLIETYVLVFYYHTIAANEFSLIFKKLNKYKLTEIDNNNYVDNKSIIKFSGYDTVVDTIVKFEFMNN